MMFLIFLSDRKEREKYGDALNEEVLNSLGEVVFQDEVYSTYILKVNK